MAYAAERGLTRGLLLLARAVQGLAAISPLALLAALMLLAVWWYDHNLRIRQAAQLSDLKKQTQVDVSHLQAQANRDVQQANQQGAREISAIESKNRMLERDAEALQRRLEDLVGRARAQAEQVATLPVAVVANRVATRLGLSQRELAREDSGSALTESKALSQPAAEGRDAPGAPVPPGKAGPAPSQARGPEPLNLGQEALRKVEAAFIELDSCKQQSQLRDNLVSNCHQQVVAKNQIIDEQKASMGRLNDALLAKDQILARRETEHRAELKAVRGTWSGRARRTLEMVGVGVAIGVAIRH
jgi:hypothetical protein